jgi:hypothetical protein
MKRLALVLILLASGPALAQAQTPAQTPASPVIDQLEPETAYSLGEYIDDTYQAARSINGLLFPVEGSFYPSPNYSKWKDPVCLNVYGLSAPSKIFVERRIREIAVQVGAPVNRSDPCEPNVTIAFTPDPAATLKSIADVRPYLVQGVGLICSRVRESLPVQAWYTNMMQNAYGATRIIPGCGGSDDIYYTSNSLFAEAASMSRLEDGLRRKLGAVTIIVDTRAVMGMPLGALADYFAMLTLAEGRPGRSCKEVESIANLMFKDCEPGLSPKQISDNDIKMLTALYSVDDDRLGPLQYVRMIGDMRRKLQAERAQEQK